MEMKKINHIDVNIISHIVIKLYLKQNVEELTECVHMGVNLEI